MEKVTLTIEGTAEEVIASIHRLQGLVVGIQDQLTNACWLTNEIEQFLDHVQPEARRILIEIAKKSDGYDRDKLIHSLGISARGLAGRLSSVGHTLRRYYPMKPKPIELDWSSWKYSMLPEFADWFRNNGSVD